MSRTETKAIRERAFLVTGGGRNSGAGEEIGDGRDGENGVNLGGEWSGSAVLRIDEGRPGEIRLEGRRIELQDKQYRLIGLLARNAGNCVLYDDVYEALWQDTIVESNQMHFQKRKLKKAIVSVLPEHGDLIKTVAERGFILQLEPSEVEIPPANRAQTQLALNVVAVQGDLINSLL